VCECAWVKIRQVRPALRVLNQQGQVPPIGEVDLGAVDGPQPERPGRNRELHRARNRIVVGQGKRFMAQLRGRRHELIRERGAIEK
jgi:hypothetical protein